MLGQPASWQTVCRPSSLTSADSRLYSGPVRSLVLIHGGLRSIGVSRVAHLEPEQLAGPYLNAHASRVRASLAGVAGQFTSRRLNHSTDETAVTSSRIPQSTSPCARVMNRSTSSQMVPCGVDWQVWHVVRPLAGDDRAEVPAGQPRRQRLLDAGQDDLADHHGRNRPTVADRVAEPPTDRERDQRDGDDSQDGPETDLDHGGHRTVGIGRHLRMVLHRHPRASPPKPTETMAAATPAEAIADALATQTFHLVGANSSWVLMVPAAWSAPT